MKETPAALGYRFPAEWEPHAATWLSWPHNRASWPDRFEPVPAIWAEFISILCQREAVHVLAGGEAVMAEARRMVGHLPRVTLHDVPTNDAWCRDHGPMFLSGAGLPPALVDWEYNAWGGKYPPFDADNLVPERVAKITGRKRFKAGIVLEGGSVDGNGLGTILVTEQCLLNENRNPGLSKSDVECYLADYCGAKKVLWLGQGIEGDDTDGHIDELARFVGPRTVLASSEPNTDDPNHAPLAENIERLKHMTDQDGRPLEVIELPMPQPMYNDGQRMPGCYANFYIANGLVVVPTFDDPADAEVLRIIGRCFPDRQVHGIRAIDLVWGLGAFHCITQQEPAV
ncbi:MAG: agmatine deiminase family protein [Planctomycetia bacterium]|nr:agmatine deiminase family protein [Planctomycetia bacterium]